MQIQILGAAKQVTGSCYYITNEKSHFLIDCGQFQGKKSEEKLNDHPFEFDPKTIDFVLITHAHIDHIGRLPKLVKEGFTGKIYMTRATASLAEILLKDSAKIHEYENEIDNEKRIKAGLEPIEAYYTLDDAINTLMYFNPIKMHQIITIDSLEITFINAGHLLGSSHILINDHKNKYLFSGDIGSSHSEILKPPKPAPQADYIFMECTYGNKVHKDINERFKKLYDLIMETTKNKGTLIIPAFSVGRTQDIIYGLRNYIKKDFKIPIYVDSPMAIHASKVFGQDTEEVRDEFLNHIQSGFSPFHLETLEFVEEAKKSHMLDQAFKDNSGPLNQAKVLISASGMCDAGRILYHLNAYLENPKTSLLFVGYQAEESLGRQIQEGKNEVEIFDKKVKNNASHYTLSGFSGHADQEELLQWLSKTKPKKVILIHGEDGLEAMQELISKTYGFQTYIPSLYEILDL